MTTSLNYSLGSLNATVTNESIANIQSSFGDIHTVLDELKASFSSSVPEGLNVQLNDMRELIQILIVLVVVAVGLALIVAIFAVITIKRLKKLEATSR
jgi:hypothetical protein